VIKIIIFGAGISGLTVAQELLEHGYDVTVYEKSENIGGFAQSNRVENEIPTEHSWRGYAPFYTNFFNIAKRIPIGNGLSVYNNLLSEPISFYLPNDQRNSKRASMWDKVYIGYFIAQCLMSNKRKEYYSSVNFKSLVENHISKEAIDKYIKMLGPGLGLDQNRTSLLHATKLAEIILNTPPHYHRTNKHTSSTGWHVMNKPTSEAWFDPWLTHLQKLGMVLHLKSKLERYSANADIINYALIRNSKGIETVGSPSTIFINCTDPFTFKTVIIKSFPNTLSCKSLSDSINLVDEGVHNQIAFFLGFNRKINIPGTTVFSFPDSEFNITFCPQDNFFQNDPFISKSGNSFWSGTICSADIKGKLFNKTAIELDQNQLFEEIIYQIFRSKEFTDFVEKYNDFSLNDLSIVHKKIWGEWLFDSKKIESSRPKWINTLKTYKFRPNQTTCYKNLYIAGAHTNTSTNIWSMEGAVESGKIVANHIDNNIVKITHTSPWYLIPFQAIDDILYMFYLPNIFLLILCACIIIIMTFIYNITSSMMKNPPSINLT